VTQPVITLTASRWSSSTMAARVEARPSALLLAAFDRASFDANMPTRPLSSLRAAAAADQAPLATRVWDRFTPVCAAGASELDPLPEAVVGSAEDVGVVADVAPTDGVDLAAGSAPVIVGGGLAEAVAVALSLGSVVGSATAGAAAPKVSVSRIVIPAAYGNQADRAARGSRRMSVLVVVEWVPSGLI
jgi:hypothetical protein